VGHVFDGGKYDFEGILKDYEGMDGESACTRESCKREKGDGEERARARGCEIDIGQGH